MTARRFVPMAVLAVTVAVLALVLAGGGHGLSLDASFADVRGLVPGADVRIAGERVGRVEHVGLDDQALPVVSMTLDHGVTLHRGLTAAVRPASLSGEFNRYVALTDGSGPPLHGSARLGLRSTRAPVEFDQALQALGPQTRSDVRAVLGDVAQTAAGRGTAMASTLRTSADALANTAEAVRQIDSDGGALRRLVAASAAVGGTLAQGRATVGDALDRTSALVAITAQRASALRETLSGLPGGLAATDGALGQVRAAIPTLRALVQTAAPGTHRLVGFSAQLDPLLHATAPVLAQSAATATRAPRALHAVRRLLVKTRPFTLEVAPVLRRLGPMLDQARVRLPDFFSFFSNWADFTANYDANGHGARVGIVLPPTSDKRLSPDSNAAGQLAAPYLRTPGSLEGVPWRDYAKSFVAGGAAPADTGGGR